MNIKDKVEEVNKSVCKETILDQLLQYLFILDALREGWHVRLLNHKTYEFSKCDSDITDFCLYSSKHFVKTFESSLTRI